MDTILETNQRLSNGSSCRIWAIKCDKCGRTEARFKNPFEIFSGDRDWFVTEPLSPLTTKHYCADGCKKGNTNDRQ